MQQLRTASVSLCLCKHSGFFIRWGAINNLLLLLLNTLIIIYMSAACNLCAATAGPVGEAEGRDGGRG